MSDPAPSVAVGPPSAAGSGRARLQALLAAALFSTGGVAIKATALSAVEVAAFRSATAALVLLAVGRCWPALAPRIDRRAWLVAVPFATTMVLFVLGNKLATAALVIFLHNTAPLYLLLLGPWLLGERWGRSDLAYLGALGLGLVLCVTGAGGGTSPLATASNPRLGALVATATGFTWALTVLGLRWLAMGRWPTTDEGPAPGARQRGSLTLGAAVAGNALAAVLVLPWALSAVLRRAAPGAAAATVGVVDWGIVLALGAFQIGAAYLFLTASVRHLPALEISLLLLLEPVLSPIWAWWAYGEAPGVLALLGGAVILGATAVRVWRGARPPGTPARRGNHHRAAG
jgi:drug/metabolite transporter (DMT)-like permease